ncbi:hypothetical protein [uncultured Roseivirga sp.]|uniref:hypothetical protein n=1 Tax=uncultured Roseivirga sp. TaxID=543088 RepID=UPI0030DC3B54|tara:strand:- start:1823 stop:2677 length:855 start_codon:yes stop_codon:yes gene_type:complete
MTKSRFLLLLFVIVSKSMMAQQYTTTGDFDRISKVTFGFGLNTYFGELSALATDTKVKMGLSTSLAYEHLFTDNIALRGSLSVYSIKGADSLSVETARLQRNLSFKATNIEFTAQALYYAYRHPHSGYKDRAFANPYFHLGLGITTNKPKATLAGTDYELRPMRLEGVEYGTIALVVPLGVGVSIFINRNVDLQLEMQYTAALTKYLDDVSANYRDPSSFADPIASQLSDRRVELGFDPAAAGDARGEGTNDSYLRFGFRLGYYLPGSLYGKSSIRCKVVKKTR